MEEILVPIFVCVVLPVAVVWLVARTRQNEANKKADIMLKAIEAGVPVDLEQFNTAGKKSPQTIMQGLMDKFTGACITSLIGIGLLVYSLIGYNNPEWIRGRLLSTNSPVFGCILLAIGIGLFISYFVGKKMLAKEIEAEEKEMEK